MFFPTSSCLIRLAPILVLLLIAVRGSAASADWQLLGISYGTEPVTLIDPATGIGTPLGTPGTGALNSAAQAADGSIYSVSGNGLFLINPTTGQADRVATLQPAGGGSVPFAIRAMAFSPDGTLFAIQADSQSSTPDDLYTIDPISGLATFIATTTAPGLQGLDFAMDGTLYAWEIGDGSGNGLGLVTVKPSNGLVTDVNPAIGGSAATIQALAFGPDGRLYGARNSLYTVDLATGAPSLVGGSGFSNVRGLAVVPEPTTTTLVSLSLLSFLLLARFARRNQCR